MPFWTTTNVTDPKRQHRWILELGTPEGGLGDVISYIAKKVNKPKITVNAVEHKFLNHTFYYPGNVTFDEVSVTLVDPANPQATALLYELIQSSGYIIPSQITDTVGVNDTNAGTMSKRLAVKALGVVKITTINGTGHAVETTELHNAWISSVDFGGDLSYDSDGLMELTMGIKFDYMKLTPGVGAAEDADT